VYVVVLPPPRKQLVLVSPRIWISSS
jgi:hypothetical protein